MTEEMRAQAEAEMKTNPRYRWVGERPRWQVSRILSRSHLCVLSSRMEGGANSLGEAIVHSVPVLASRIGGSIGILGNNYPGYFEVGATDELARLMLRAETEPRFLNQLRGHCKRLVPIFDPAREKKAWSRLLDDLT
jgi:glycosyltransferase involved in cell wall biosynthesis